MKSATRILASVLGVYAGLLGATHGILEIRQGDVTPGAFLIQAIGPPCEMNEIWHGCWPAVTVVPNYLVTGVLALLVSLAVVVWAAFFVQRKRGGLILILLSLAMLPVGGGFIPMVIGVIAGAVGTRINTPLAWWRKRLSGNSLRFFAGLWPWPLVVYFLWVASQWLLGHFFNDAMMDAAFALMPFEFGLLLLSIVTGFARDIHKATASRQADAVRV